MRYADLRVGQDVLYSTDRTSSRDFSVGRTALARITGLNLAHEWYATAGYSSGGGRRTTSQGVRVRVGGTEFVTLAAHLVEATPENLAVYEAAQARLAEKRQKREELDELAVRFKILGFEVTVGTKTTALSEDDARRLLERLER